MASEGTERRLAVFMLTDLAGYRVLMDQSEERGLRVRDRHHEVVRRLVGEHGGRLLDARHDQSDSVFRHLLDAVKCALAIQESMKEPEIGVRIGIHQGGV